MICCLESSELFANALVFASGANSMYSRSILFPPPLPLPSLFEILMDFSPSLSSYLVGTWSPPPPPPSTAGGVTTVGGWTTHATEPQPTGGNRQYYHPILS